MTQTVASFDTGNVSQRIMGQTETETEAEVEALPRDRQNFDKVATDLKENMALFCEDKKL